MPNHPIRLVGLVHACAVTTDGELYCWGWNVFGQLGLGTHTLSEPPTRVAGGPYVSTTAGALHSCAIDAAGSGFCWGDRFSLGTGSRAGSPSPAAVAGGLAFAEIDASPGNYIFTHTCAVTTAGAAYCWGWNSGFFVSSGRARDGALGVQLAPDTCQLGTLPSFDCALSPVAVSGGIEFARVTTGRAFTCGYAVAGDVYCWGDNEAGQLGNGSTTSTRQPVKVATSQP